MNYQPNAKLRTCLWFERDGAQAADYYVSLLPDSRIETKIDPQADQPAIQVIEFRLAGAPFMILNTGVRFEPTPATSIAVLTDDQAETDRLWDTLIGDGGSEQMCGWLTDRYGVSWQLTPRALPRLFSAPDRAAASRAHAAMLQMKRIDIAAIERAFRGES
ncbi:MAG: VOC family protein [Burkholderiaceae bacterium]